MKRIVWKHPDGTVEISVPCAPMLEAETENAYLDRIARRTKAAVPHLANAVRIADISDAEHKSMDRSSRETWRATNGGIAVPAKR